jgi:hypothetical protein
MDGGLHIAVAVAGLGDCCVKTLEDVNFQAPGGRILCAQCRTSMIKDGDDLWRREGAIAEVA